MIDQNIWKSGSHNRPHDTLFPPSTPPHSSWVDPRPQEITAPSLSPWPWGHWRSTPQYIPPAVMWFFFGFFYYYYLFFSVALKIPTHWVSQPPQRTLPLSPHRKLGTLSCNIHKTHPRKSIHGWQCVPSKQRLFAQEFNILQSPKYVLCLPFSRGALKILGFSHT